jgi:hypothetical protein
MAATNAQQSALAASPGFKAQVKASVMKKALSIIENPGSYTAPQVAKAKAVVQGFISDIYYTAVASSTNVIASNITWDFTNACAVSDITEAALDSQVFTVVFTDLA